MRLGSSLTSKSACSVLLLLLTGIATLEWACSDDPAPAEGAPDGGNGDVADIPVTPGPTTPLACEAAKAAEDPCTATRPAEPTSFLATQLDGGYLPDAEPTPTDAGVVLDAAPGTCAASGSVNVVCGLDAGAAIPPVQFDIAGDGVGTQLAAWANRGTTRILIDPEGELSDPSTIDAPADMRVFVRDGDSTPIYLSAASGSESLSFFTPTKEDFALGAKLDATTPLLDAQLASDGTLFALVKTTSTQLVTLPRISKGKDAKIEPAPAGVVLGVDRSNRPLLVDIKPDGLIVIRPTGTTEAIKQDGISPLAVASLNDDNPIVAAFDEGDLAVFASLGTDTHDYAEMKIVRGTHCKQNGCGYTCTEEGSAVPGLGAAFVRDSFDDPFLVYLEASVTQDRTYKAGSSPVTKPCTSSTEVKSVKETAVVVMGVEKTPVLRLVERARARVVFDPKVTLVDGAKRPIRRILASVHGDTLHVGIPQANNTMTRVILEIGR